MMEALHKMWRQNHIADAQGRGKRLCKGIHIDDTLVCIKALQRRDRPSGKTKFAVIIVLDDVAFISFASPVQKGLPAANGSNDTKREVVRGRYMQNIGRAGGERINICLLYTS